MEIINKTSKRAKKNIGSFISFIKIKELINKFYPYILISPLFCVLTLFYIVPIIMTFILSFTDYNIMTSPVFNGFSNYKNLLKDKIFIKSIVNTFYFMIIVVPVQTTLSFIMAYWLTSWKDKLIAKITKLIIFIPVITSMVLVSILWRILLNGETSPINLVTSIFGKTSANWLGSSKTALPTLMVIFIWKNIGYFMILYIAGLMNIPKSLYEAAKVDGANELKRILHITIPLLKRTNVMVIFLGTLWSFQVFDLVYNLTGGGPGTSTMTMVVHIYNLSFKQFNTGYAMAVANILLFIVAVLSIIQKKLLKI